MKNKTLFDKIWDNHVVSGIENGPDILYIDKHLVHEVTSPQAFAGLKKRNLPVFRRESILATVDHNVPTLNQGQEIQDLESRNQIETLEENCKLNDLKFFGLNHHRQGIVHVIGPQLGFSLPGNTIVCGDSHTSTHGAFGAIAFGIGTSEVETVMATQCLLQHKPKKMRIVVEGKLQDKVTAKDLILHIISKLTSKGATGYFVEYAGEAIRALSMESRMTVCNMSIEMGARGGLIAPDEKTFDYLNDKLLAPKHPDCDTDVKHWQNLRSDEAATFDKEYVFHADDISPMITYGTNPGMGISIDESIPNSESLNQNENDSFSKALKYMDFSPGDKMIGKKIDYVFLGSCTNGRIEDFRAFAEIVKGRKKASHVIDYIVPGSKMVEKQIRWEGIDKVLANAGFTLRQPGCSACLAMNDDKVPSGAYCVSTSNRNFEGRQGPGSRTLLASPYTAAVAAVCGYIEDPRKF